MCDYCGCQNIPAIAQLTAEHDQIREVAREARHALDANDRAATAQAVSRLLALLGPHTSVEEHGLFPAMARHFADHVATLQRQHRHIEDVLARASTGTAPAQHVRAVLDELFEHILAEQDGLFPAALATLGPNDWESVDAARAATSASAPGAG